MTWSLAAGSIGSALFVVTALVDGVTRPGYEPRRHTVSALATGSRGWLQATNFVVCGLLVIVSVHGVRGATGSWWLAGAVAVFGLALVASGVFPMDPMRGYPPGTAAGDPVTVSRAHQWHDRAGAVVFASLPMCAVVAAFTLDDTAWAVVSGIVAVYLIVMAGRFATAWEADAPRTGLAQRAFIVPGWIWLAAVSWHLIP